MSEYSAVLGITSHTRTTTACAIVAKTDETAARTFRGSHPTKAILGAADLIEHVAYLRCCRGEPPEGQRTLRFPKVRSRPPGAPNMAGLLRPAERHLGTAGEKSPGPPPSASPKSTRVCVLICHPGVAAI